MMASTTTTSPDASVHVKVSINGSEENRKFKLALKDLGAAVLPDKVCHLPLVKQSRKHYFDLFGHTLDSYESQHLFHAQRS